MRRRSSRKSSPAPSTTSSTNTSSTTHQPPPSTTTTTSASKASGKRKQQQPQPADDSTTPDVPAPLATSSTSRNKRKSVAFEPQDLELPTAPSSTSNGPSSRATRSRRSSAASTTSTASQPSAKALGKRRAVSPPPIEAPVPVPAPAPSTTSTNKRRKLSHVPAPAPTPASTDKDYNLRKRPSTTRSASNNNTTSSNKTSKSSSSTKKPRVTASTAVAPAPAPVPSKPMPRKGSRASRAAVTKARAAEEDDHELDFALDEDDVIMADPQPSASNAKGGAASASNDSEHQIVEHHSDEEHDSDDDDGHNDDDDEEDDEDEDADDDDEDEQNSEGHHDEEDEEYEMTLRADGLPDDGGYDGTGSESDLHEAPQTFDADGSPLASSSQLMDRQALEDAAAEAEAALFGGGGAGGAGAAFRTLHGIMSGMSSRLKGLLASLKAKDGDSGAKLIALQDLAELLSVSTEDTLAGYFQVEAFVKEIVSILRGDSNGGRAGGGGAGASGMTAEEMIAFGLDPSEAGGDTEENDVQMMLLACRCLANLMEALPGSAHSVVYAGAVPVLCSKLMEIQYIDLAEQTLSTLEKISEEVPSAIVREGGLSALLTYLDFFSFHVQRTAVTAAANCCRSLSPDSFTVVREVIPIFKNILGYPDQRVVEQGCLAVVRIVESYRHYPDKLESLLSEDLLAAVRALLNPDSTTVGPNTYTQTLKMLSTASKASPGVAISLVELNLGNTIYHLLTGVAPPEFESEEGPQVVKRPKEGGDDMLVMQNLVQKPKEQIQETLNLVCEMLPPLPKDGIFDSRAFTGKSRSSKPPAAAVASIVKREQLSPDLNALADPEPIPVASSSAAAVDDNDSLAEDVKMEVLDDMLPPPITSSTRASSRSGKPRDVNKEALVEKRLEFFASGPDSRVLVVKRFYALLLPILVDVCAASVNTQVRAKAVLGLLKIVNLCDKDSLASILHTVSMASFLAAILSSRDQGPLVTNALQLVELLLVKMPDAYQYFFRREGVMHEIERLAATDLVSSKSKRASPARTPREDTSAPSGSTSGPSRLTRALQQQATADATASPTPLTPVEAQAQDQITLRARHLRDTYAGADTEPALRARAALDKIEALVAKLEGFIEAKLSSPGSKAMNKLEKDAKSVVAQVAALFSDQKSPLSSFELLESGLVKGLLRFSTEVGTSGLTPARRQELLAQAFIPQLENHSPNPAFGLLVKRLQESLSRMEEFEVTLAAQSASDADSRRNGPSMLARQLKLRLIAEEGSDVPRSCTNIVVSIHAIATFQAFNDYLRPRIIAATSLNERLGGSSSAPQAGGAGRLSSFLAAFAAANGASPPPDSAAASGSASRLSSSLGAAIASSSGLRDDDGDDDDEDEAGAPPPPPVASGSTSGSPPKRRRSTRLSGKGLPDTTSTSPPKPTVEAPAEAAASAEHAMDEDVEVCEEDEDHDDEDDDDLFAGGFEPAPPSRDERPVNLEVADDGSKVVAKTPDGTRVGTPTLGNSASAPRPAVVPKPRASYAAAVKTEPADFHLEFTMGGNDVDLDTTVYGAVHTHEGRSTPPGGIRRNIWHAIHEVRFRKIAGPARVDPEQAQAAREAPAAAVRGHPSMMANMPDSIPVDSQQAKILQLLWVLHRLNSEYGDGAATASASSTGVGEVAFVNNKLTAKLNRQLEEPMIVASACLPEWANDLPQFFPFLFPFDTRYTFLQSTAFGYARLMQKWVGQARADNSRRDDNLGFLSRLQRQKVRISRDRMLESAFKVFELYGSSRASLEVEFFSEVGSGLGPTLEFYALVSKEFARKDLNLWREGDNTTDSEFTHNLLGLFPRPVDDFTTEAGKKTLKVFRVLGQFVAKALMDSRIIDVNFSRTFMRLVLDHDVPLSIASVKSVDKNLGKSLAVLQQYVSAKEVIEADETKTEEERAVAIEAITVSDATLADLTLDFTLPGYDIELCEGGKDITVDSSNLEEYMSLVIDWTLQKGIEQQLKEFKTGFSSVFPVRDLQSFTPNELVMMTGTLDEDWSVECLTNSTKADHGFTMDSRPVKDLISLMSQYTTDERRAFLSFITGSPRLPIGGFAALSPTLTIVRKEGGDQALPSVMTCTNYVKLPNFSTREILESRVNLAVREGAGSFLLS